MKIIYDYLTTYKSDSYNIMHRERKKIKENERQKKESKKKERK